MKKLILAPILVIAFGHFSYAQWTTSGTSIYNSNTGNVGIGTTSPAANLHLLKTSEQLRLAYDASNYTSFTTAAEGSVSLRLYGANTPNALSFDFAAGTTPGTNPQVRLFKNTALPVAPGVTASFAIYPGVTGLTGAQDYFASNGITYLNALAGNLTVGAVGGGASKVSVAANISIGSTYYTTAAPADGLLVQGNVIVGATSQSNSAYKLDVYGSERANAVVVNTTGADFVFDPSYRLKSLSYLEMYIANNHHLPEIPSAKQMQAEGLNLGDNQIKLLQKVEELTLYLIEKDKELKEDNIKITEQDKINSEQSARLESQTDQINKLSKQVEYLIEILHK